MENQMKIKKIIKIKIKVSTIESFVFLANEFVLQVFLFLKFVNQIRMGFCGRAARVKRNRKTQNEKSFGFAHSR